MRRWISASLFASLMTTPAWAQPLQGKLETQDSVDTRFVDPIVPRRVPIVQPRTPTEDDLRPVQGGTADQAPNGVWSMTILPVTGTSTSINSTDITWGVEYANPRLHHDWGVWLSRIMLVIYQDCSRFRCPSVADHTCTIHVRRDGVVVANIKPDGDIPSTLFRNAVLRLQGQQILDFPSLSKQEKVEFKLNLHYGKPVPNSSIFNDPFGQPDARSPIDKTNW